LLEYAPEPPFNAGRPDTAPQGILARAQKLNAAAERFWSPNYIQHSAQIEPGRDGLFNLIKSTTPTLKYEPGIIVADGDFVIIHGRFSGIGLAVIATDIIRMKDGVLVEHWDVNTFAFGRTKPPVFFSPMTSPKNSPSPTCILE
jgi:predicted SnoaL-like aldol condensation-catalyzing enzyme